MVGLIRLLARRLKRLIVYALALWGRTWSGVCQGSLSDCKIVVSGAALNVTIRLSILLRHSQSQTPALTGVEMSLDMLLPTCHCRCLLIQTVAQHCLALHHKPVTRLPLPPAHIWKWLKMK
jgi:hypothetical protein